jgi:hypothetical protein
MKAFKSAILHAIEFFVIAGGAYLILHYFDPDPETKALIVGTVVAFFIKYARSNPKIPLKDYVNKE